MPSRFRLRTFAALGFLTPAAIAGETHLTIYTSDFAVVRDAVPLDLKPGENRVRYADMTAHAETDSVILRDPSGRAKLSILEQDYRADPLSQELLLKSFEGQTIPFLVTVWDKQSIKPGKILRSGYVPHSRGLSRYGQQYYQTQMAMAYGSSGMGQPIVEMDGTIRFGLPGQPLFPSLGDDTILKPTMDWTIATDSAARIDAELAYVTGGMGWQADYNVVAAEKGDVADLSGWVTIDNQSGKTFENARVKLMAGDVNKIKAEDRDRASGFLLGMSESSVRPVSEKAFDDLHLYTLARPTTVRDRETKQVELVRAEGVVATKIYVYDGAFIDRQQWAGNSDVSIRSNEQFGTQSNPKVWVMREIENTAKNHLGIPLPKGRVRFYRRDSDERLEFVGENLIDHTPRDEKLRVYTGNAFDIVGERTRTNFHSEHPARWLEESFEIVLRNHKAEPVEIRVVEHLYRWTNWEIKNASQDWKKKDSRTIEFRVTLKPDAVQKVTYTAHYSW